MKEKVLKSINTVRVINDCIGCNNYKFMDEKTQCNFLSAIDDLINSGNKELVNIATIILHKTI